MADVDGTCEARFDGVRKALAASLDSGADVGASVAVYLHGEPVVDIWGGYVDEAKSAPWERDTLTNVWSTTKTMTFVCALMLADRKQLDFHAPVATYWPEFAQGGKEARRGTPPHGPHGGTLGLGPADHRRAAGGLGALHHGAGRPGAVVGARNGLRLPRPDAGVPDRRGRAPHHRRLDRHLVRQ